MSKKNFFESNNPMMKEEVLRGTSTVLDSEMVYSGDLMTVNGAVNKTLILSSIALATAVAAFIMGNYYIGLGGVFGGMAVYFIAGRSPEKTPTLAPLYAVMEGLVLGSFTAMYAQAYEGIIFMATTLTFAIMFTMLMLYKSGMVKVTERFRNIIMTAVGAIMLLYLVSFGLYLFGIDMPYLHDRSPIGIGISLVIVCVASMKLLVDFDNFEKGEQMKTPAYMEWYFSMGLLFTMVWLYLEVMWLASNLLGGD